MQDSIIKICAGEEQNKLQKWLFKCFPVEDLDRTKKTEILTIINYAFDYLIIIACTFITFFIFTIPFSSTIAEIIALSLRALAVILFVLTKHLEFIIFNKIAMLGWFVFRNSPLMMGMNVLIFCMEVIGAAIWSFMKEQRPVHFDSRLDLLKPFCKQVLVYSIVSLTPVFSQIQGTSDGDSQLLSVVILMLILIVDYRDMVYREVTKKMWVGVDVWVILTFGVVFPIQNHWLLFSPSSFCLHSAFLLILVYFVHSQQSSDIEMLYEINLSHINSYSDQVIINFYFRLLEQLKHKDPSFMDLYLRKYMSQTANVQNKQKIQAILLLPDKLSNEVSLKYQLIEKLIFRDLQELSLKRATVCKFVLFYYSPQEKIYKIINKNIWYHQREYQRILSLEKDAVNLMMLTQTNKEIISIKNKLIHFITIAKHFYSRLRVEKIIYEELLTDGFAMIKIINSFEKKKVQHHHKLNENCRILLNKFSSQVINFHTILLENQKDPIYLMKDTSEDLPKILISAEENTFGNILDFDESFMKLTYFTKEDIQRIELDQIIPIEIRQKIINENNLTSKSNQETTIEFELYILNKEGYLVLSQMKIYLQNHMEGREWCLVLLQKYICSSIFVITQGRTCHGCTELCIAHGMNSNVRGNTINLHIFNMLMQNKKYQIDTKTTLFEDYYFTFNSCKVIKLQKIIPIQIVGFQYYLIKIENKDSKILTEDEYNLKIKQSQGIKVHSCQSQLPLEHNAEQFQFYYHWQGKISNIKDENEKYFAEMHIEANIIKDDEFVQNKTERFEENIIQMRLMKENKIDFIENIDEEQQFQGFPQNQQITLTKEECTLKSYEHLLSSKKSKQPQWLTRICIFICCVIICNLGLFVSMEIIRTNNIASNQSDLSVILNLNSIIFESVNLAELSVVKYYDKNANKSSLIEQQVSTLREFVNAINANDGTLFLDNSLGLSLTSLSKNLSILMNSYLVNGTSAAEQGILNFISTQFYPVAVQFLKSTLDERTNNTDLSITNIIMIIVASISCLLMIWVMKIVHTLKCKELFVAGIWKNIENAAIDREINKILEFQEENIYEEDRKDKQEPNKTDQVEDLNFSNEHPKRVERQSSGLAILIVIFLWLICQIAILFYSERKTSQLNHSRVDQYMIHHTASMVALNSYNLEWIEMNKFPINMTNLQYLHTNVFSKQSLRLELSNSIFGNSSYSENYAVFYRSFWSQNACQYYSNPHCSTQIFGSLAAGTELMFAYLSRKFDYVINAILTTKFTANSIHVNTDGPTISRLLSQYFPEINKALCSSIQTEFEEYVGWLNLRLYSLFAVLVLINISLLLVYVYFRDRAKHLIKIQQLLLLVPFDAVLKVPEFRKYYKDQLNKQIYQK